MLEEIANSVIMKYILYVAFTVAVANIIVTPDVTSANTAIGYALAIVFYQVARVRHGQVRYLVEELKKTGARVFSGEEEL
jgi:hypothetical protein